MPMPPPESPVPVLEAPPSADSREASPSGGPRNEVIVSEGLTKVYPGAGAPQGADSAEPVPAVDHLDLSVTHGEIFGLLGPNGAGKTTTAGMLTTRVLPTSGRAVVGGIDVVAHPALARQAIGVVPQQNTLDRSLTVWENLYYHGRFFRMSRGASHPPADHP